MSACEIIVVAGCGVVALGCIGGVLMILRRRHRLPSDEIVPGSDDLPALTGAVAVAVTVAAMVFLPDLTGWAEALIGGVAALVGGVVGQRLADRVLFDPVAAFEKSLK